MGACAPGADRFAHSAGLEGRQENHEEQKRKSWMMTKTMLRMMTVVKMRIMRDSHDALFLIVFLWSPRYLPIFSGFRSPGGAPRPPRRLPKGGQNKKKDFFALWETIFLKASVFLALPSQFFWILELQRRPKASQKPPKMKPK